MSTIHHPESTIHSLSIYGCRPVVPPLAFAHACESECNHTCLHACLNAHVYMCKHNSNDTILDTSHMHGVSMATILSTPAKAWTNDKLNRFLLLLGC